MHNGERKRPEFDSYASSYSDLLDDPMRNRFARDPLHFHRRKWALLQSLFERVGLDPASLRWLDVGCGQGELLSLAGQAFASASGCDPAAQMLPPNASFHCAVQPYLLELPFENASVDFVTAVCVYHHVQGAYENTAARSLLTNEIKRVLSPGGLCCIIEHNPWNPVTQAIVKRCAVDVDAQLLTARATIKLLQGSGFGIISTDYFLYLPESLFPRFRAFERPLAAVPLGGQYAVLARSPE